MLELQEEFQDLADQGVCNRCQPFTSSLCLCQGRTTAAPTSGRHDALHCLVRSKQKGAPDGSTHRDARVLVQDDLQQVWREDGRGFESLFWFRDVRLLVVGSWGGAGQLCWEMATRHSDHHRLWGCT